MVKSRTIALIAGLVSIVIWRSGSVARNSIFAKHHFPAGYFAGGDFDTDCTTLKAPDLKYCEDITSWDLLDAQGKFVNYALLISCDAGRKSWNTVMGPLKDPKPRGSLWLYEHVGITSKYNTQPDPSKLKRLELKGYPANHDFHPLGLEISPSYAGNTSNLYVVNHARTRTVIEHFTLSHSTPTIATYVRTLASPYFHSANAIALTSPDSFYVTNDHLFTRRLPYIGHILPILESIFALPFSFVSHVTLSTDPSAPPIQSHAFSTLFMPFPNGIAVSPTNATNNHVALASTTLGKIFIYTRDPKTNALTKLIHTIPVPFVPDNIHYTHDGSALIVTGHPSFPTLAALAANKTDVAPSWVVSITLTAPDGPPIVDFDTQAPVSAKGKVPAVTGHELTTLFQSDGSGFSSSSTALQDPVTGALYISGLYAEEGVIVCHNKQS